MGFLDIKGKMMTYSEYKEFIESYKRKGLLEFLEIYKAHKADYRDRKDLHWGEELEYTLYYMDKANRKVQLTNKGYDLIQDFNKEFHDKEPVHLHPEFGNWMVEAVPMDPYGAYEDLENLLTCFEKLKYRRQLLKEFFCKRHGLCMASVATPMVLGTKDHIHIQDPELLKRLEESKGDLESINEYSKSVYTIDGTENPHPRFSGLMKSIRERRGKKVCITVPLYNDVNTNSDIITTSSVEQELIEPYPGQIHMDSMHFGMGCSCLQVTFECQTLNHARYLHDMLLPFTPLLAALSASAPIFKGKLADVDLRWTVISQSVDCRTEDEMNTESPSYIPKSRYSTMNHYISSHKYVKDVYFDTYQYKVNPDHMKVLTDEGLDERLAFHISQLFVRDPIPTYDYEHNDEDYDPRAQTAHFENLQSSNWNSMRFKPPPSWNSPIGWRVEFRPMDIQLSDFENSALIVLLSMINNVINHFDLDFIMPISKIDENMERAHKRDAASTQKFWFKINILPTGKCYRHNTLEQSDYQWSNTHWQKTEDELYQLKESHPECHYEEKKHYVVEELYLWEIFEGKPEIKYKGIYPLIEEYLKDKQYGETVVCQIRVYLNFLMRRAKGEVKTGARLIRDFVTSHPEYKHDSIVPNSVSFDLMCSILQYNNQQEESKIVDECRHMVQQDLTQFKPHQQQQPQLSSPPKCGC